MASPGILHVIEIGHDLGTFAVAATGQGLRLVLLRGLSPGELDATASREGLCPRMGGAGPAVVAARQIREYLDGHRRSFGLKLDLEGTDFQMRVWQALARVPYGRTVTYAQLARQAGRPGAARAAGSACGANPLPLVIPCHRVLASGGRIGGFGGGLSMKRALLALEKAGSPDPSD